ncbi:MAG: DNA-binding protein [Bacteroidetes bacterium]|jgi:hypothetical protein|nr:DNA-binding protein [Bacteroidota bacterium]MBT6687397.1 DNA-binding protein [Bacteroidota bacterium]MBT7142599.1 DNA-binding protein [Bacteroidota bacterium]MBT7490132.1 DNA-binding protein [Bacteroidota bacterium]
MSNKNEIILYQPDDLSTKLEVRVEEDTIWLTQVQIVTLFDSSKANISEHIKHIFQTNELEENPTVRKIRTVQKEGNRTVSRDLIHYNLDMIISIGYRVNSIRGTQFRIWANKVLKDYLLKGYSLNKRMNRIEESVNSLVKKVDVIDLQINTNLPPKQGIFYDGQVFDAYVFVADLIKSAKQSILLIDNYIDESVLQVFTKRKQNVSVNIYTKNITKILKQDLEKHNKQHPKIQIKKFTKAHDRFLIIDKTTVYHFGASLKDLGKKWFAFSKMEMEAMEMIANLRSLSGGETKNGGGDE